MISKSMDELFIERLREIITEQQNHIDSLTYDCSENTKEMLRKIKEIEALSLENKSNLETINKETYFLEKFNYHLELELAGYASRESISSVKK